MTEWELIADNMRLRTALLQIAKEPKGAYSMNHDQYLKNVIEWCQDTAAVALRPTEEKP